MKKLLFGLLLCASVANGETIATQPNQAGGKIVLTDEICKYNGEVFDKINRAYNYGSAGYTRYELDLERTMSAQLKEELEKQK